MRIRLGTLRRFIREAKSSPSLFMNNKPVSDPFERKSVANAIQGLESSYKGDLVTNMMLSNADKYNADSREFDDAAYKQIDDIASETTEAVVAKCASAIRAGWAQAHRKLKGDERAE